MSSAHFILAAFPVRNDLFPKSQNAQFGAAQVMTQYHENEPHWAAFNPNRNAKGC